MRHVIGFVPADDEWKRKKKAWDACKAAGVDPPGELETFFDERYAIPPGDDGMTFSESKLMACGAVVEWTGDAADGWELIVAKLPKGVKRVRFYNSY